MTCLAYSLGHSVHQLDRLIELCTGAGIDLLCDIRRFPRSRRNPQFSRERLERELPGHGISYVWLGETLGGFREGGYEAWMETDSFERGLRELEELAREGITGFMCSEGSPDRCHRRFVANALASRGHRIGHLLPDGAIVWVQPTLELPNR
jgi:uncharacterized protein (DUF488 family)